MIITICIVPALMLLAACGTLIFWVTSRRRERARRELQLKMSPYNYDMAMYSAEPPLVNVADLKLDTCIHRGRFGDVRTITHAYTQQPCVCVRSYVALG